MSVEAEGPREAFGPVRTVRSEALRLTLAAGFAAYSLASLFPLAPGRLNNGMLLLAVGALTATIVLLFGARDDLGRRRPSVIALLVAAPLVAWGVDIACTALHDITYAVPLRDRGDGRIWFVPLGMALAVVDRIPWRLGSGGCVALLLILIGTPHFTGGHGYGGAGACFNTQKALADAIEMYRQDRPNQPVAPLHRLDRQFLEELVAKGYLQSLPRDPGQTGDTTDHFYLTPRGLACVVHGTRPAQPPASHE